MLGWKIIREGDYKIDLPPLSESEERIILAVEDSFRIIAGEKRIGPENLIQELSRAVSKKAEDESLLLEPEQKEYIVRYAKMHIYGFAFLDEFIGRDDIEEISVIGVGKPAYVFVRKEGWKSVNALFEDEKTLMDVVNKMAKGIGRRITLQHPRLDAMLPDGSRLHASIHPISRGEITVRRFRQNPFSPKEIVQLGTTDYLSIALFSLIMQTDSSLIISGNTASGKTTTLNSLFSFVPRSERILITEETPEISVPHEHQVRLIANKDMEIALKDLVYDSLRMRPDRMIVGEARNREESEALFDVLLGGQARGVYATFHAQSAQEALFRLMRLGISQQDLGSIDAIIVQRRMLIYDPRKRRSAESRRITEIAEISDGKAKPLLLNSRNCKQSGKSGIFARLSNSLGMSSKELHSELSFRENWIKNAPAAFIPFFDAAQKKFHGL